MVCQFNQISRMLTQRNVPILRLMIFREMERVYKFLQIIEDSFSLMRKFNSKIFRGNICT